MKQIKKYNIIVSNPLGWEGDPEFAPKRNDYREGF